MSKARQLPKRRKLRGKKVLVVGGIALASLVGCDDVADEDANDENVEVEQVDEDGHSQDVADQENDQDEPFYGPVGNLLVAPEIEGDVPLEEPTPPQETPTDG